MKRKKKYNPRKVIEKVSESIATKEAKSVVIAWRTTMKLPAVFDTDGEPVSNPTEHLRKFLKTIPQPWSTHCLAMCRDQTNKEYISEIFITSKGKYTYAEMSDLLIEEHLKFLKTQNDLHKVCAGWISIPTGEELPLSVIDKIMTSLGAWDYMAKWEAQLQETTNETN